MTALTQTITPEIVPSDPAERLAQIEAELESGIALINQGQQQIWAAIAQVQSEPALLSSRYTGIHDWLEQRFGWQKSNRYEMIAAATTYASFRDSGKSAEELPTSAAAMRALNQVPQAQRPIVLEKAGPQPTAKAIKQAAGLPAKITLADGLPCQIGDHIAYAESPTALVGRVTGFTPESRIEYTRFKKTLYIDPGVVVHQGSVASPAAVPHPAALSADDAQTIAEAPQAAVGDSERGRMDVHFSSESPEHYTPQIVIDAVLDCLGEIDLDPCSNSHHSPQIPAANHYTRDDDGLAQQWAGRVYMNPPYGREIGPWVEKLCSEHEAGNVAAAIALVPARTDTQWFKRLQDYCWCAVEGRLRFVGNDDSAAPFPSSIFYLGEDIGAFYRSFAHIGSIYQRLEPEMFGE